MRGADASAAVDVRAAGIELRYHIGSAQNLRILTYHTLVTLSRSTAARPRYIAQPDLCKMRELLRPLVPHGLSNPTNRKQQDWDPRLCQRVGEG